MAHTLSPRRRAHAILDLPARELRSCILIADCGCGARELPIGDLAATFGATDQTLATIILRMRCRTCRRPPMSAWVRRVGGLGRVAVWGLEAV